MLVSRLCDLWPSEKGKFSRECCRVPTLWASQIGGQCEPRLRDDGMETPGRAAGFATNVESGLSRKGGLGNELSKVMIPAARLYQHTTQTFRSSSLLVLR